MLETRQYKTPKLLPLYDPDRAIELPVNLGPNLTLVRGTVLGQITAAVNEVQTLTVTGTPTGGSLTVSIVHPITGATLTFSVAFDSTNAQAQTAARAVLGPNVTVTGGALPGTPLVFTFNTDFAGMPIAPMTISANGLTGGTNPAGTFARTTTGRTANTFVAYADGNSDGSQTARCILAYDCATDAGGNITFGNTAGADRYLTKDAPAYFIGIFATTELIGLDAAAVTDLGRLMSGSVSSGVLSMS
jgi:hypothetical protein